ncbi:MAG: diadenosine tetraphosphatase [Ignavibacteria bacterium RBG_16_35_7]|nr:MAG: diadenosine tetraphosphatase [Ignavibacteria bacterium RBG_16_35_7]
MVAVIGDIHGCLNTLRNLVEQIRQKYPSIEIFSVGDLVDRGNFSYEVIEFIKSEKIKFTAGNHDYMMYYFIKHPNHEIGKPWPYNGYETTLMSYNEHFDKMNEHLEVIINHPLYYNLDECLISHAGISKYMKKLLPNDFEVNSSELDEVVHSNINSEDGILWTRGTLLNIGKLQVVGHTIKKDVIYSEKSNAIYIDTGVYLGNKLSAVIVENGKLIEVLQEKTHHNDIRPNY